MRIPRIIFLCMLCLFVAASLSWAGGKPSTDTLIAFSDEVTCLQADTYKSEIQLAKHHNYKYYGNWMDSKMWCKSKWSALACHATLLWGKASNRCNQPGKPRCHCDGCRLR